MRHAVSVPDWGNEASGHLARFCPHPVSRYAFGQARSMLHGTSGQSSRSLMTDSGLTASWAAPVLRKILKQRIEMVQKVKNTMKSVLVLMAGSLVFSACQREVTEVYMFSFDERLSVSGGLSSVGITASFLNSAGWSDVKKYGNEAYSDKNARRANEEEALVDFDYKLATFDSRLPSLYEEYRLAGVDSASGEVTLRLSCMSDGVRIVKEASREIFYAASVDTVSGSAR